MKFAFNTPDGSVTILGAAPKDQLEKAIGTPRMVDGVLRRVLTDNEYRSHVINRNMQKGVIPANASDFVELADDWVAPSRTFRAAWTKNGTTFGHDMSRAREIHMGRIRKARDAKLSELDIQWMKATGQKNPQEADAVEADRQKLRDIPQTFDLEVAATAAELKALWPAELA